MTTFTETTDDRKFTKCRRRTTTTTTKWASPKWLERPEIYRRARDFERAYRRRPVEDEAEPVYDPYYSLARCEQNRRACALHLADLQREHGNKRTLKTKRARKQTTDGNQQRKEIKWLPTTMSPDRSRLRKWP
jgi:hypothetical protein